MNTINNGTTLLHFACSVNNDEMVKLLLENGANPSIVETTHQQYTTMHLAALKGNLKIVKLLVEYGFDLKTLINAEAAIITSRALVNFTTVFLILCENGNVECMKYFFFLFAKILLILMQKILVIIMVFIWQLNLINYQW